MDKQYNFWTSEHGQNFTAVSERDSRSRIFNRYTRSPLSFRRAHMRQTRVTCVGNIYSHSDAHLLYLWFSSEIFSHTHTHTRRDSELFSFLFSARILKSTPALCHSVRQPGNEDFYYNIHLHACMRAYYYRNKLLAFYVRV